VRIILLGVTTRAMAESAVADGHHVVAVDFFGDRDQASVAESYGLSRDLGLPATATGLVEGARLVGGDAVVYGSSFENHPEAIDELAGRWIVLGNPADVVREVRDWALLRRFCREEGIAYPETLLPGEEGRADTRRWLKKPQRSGGGHGVVVWDGSGLDDDHLLQAEVGGTPASVAFVADGRKSQVFGLTEQMIGEPELGGSGFAWCGNLSPLRLPAEHKDPVRAEIERMTARLTCRFGLVGVNGADLVIGRDAGGAVRPYLIEVNPRFSGSMELAEAACDAGAFTLHLEGVEGRLPRALAGRRDLAGCAGKGVVYAKRTVTVGDTGEWRSRGLRDVPWPGQRIAAGHPLCTVLAHASDPTACRHGLFAAARQIYADCA
jgi:predicted ATP-grasp superfamily ATP-dependent carboligase